MTIKQLKKQQKNLQQLETESHYQKTELQELQRHLQLFKAFFAHASAGMAILDDSLAFIEVNPIFAQLHGYSVPDLLGKTIHTVLPELAPVLEPIFRQVLETRQPLLNLALSTVTSVSEKGQSWQACFPLLDSEEKLLGIGWMVVDIPKFQSAEVGISCLNPGSEEQRHEEMKSSSQLHDKTEDEINPPSAEVTLYQQERGFRTLAEKSPDIIARFDRESRYVYINPAIESVAGKPAFNFIGKRVKEMEMPEDSAFSWYEAIQSCFETAKEQLIEFEWQSTDGKLKTYETYLIPEFRANGVVEFVLSFSHDITLAKQTELNFKQVLAKEQDLNRMKSRFISMISHEFRTPLTIILSSVDLLEQVVCTPLEKQQLFNQVKGSVQYMNQLLSDLLLIGHNEAGKLKVQPTCFELPNFIDTVVNEFKILRGDNKRIVVKNMGQSNKVQLDKKLLRQIISNLLENAIKYSPEGTSIYLKFGGFEGKVVLQVKDRGIGIPPEDQLYLFEYFHRASNVSEISGTGLGLAVVKQCVDLHGGEITIDSLLGLGTTFTVTLPQGK